MPKLVQKYASLIDPSDLSNEEASFIGRFSVDMAAAKLAGDEDLQHKYLEAFALSLPDTVRTKVARLLDEISVSGDMEKAAFDWKGVAGNVGKGVLYSSVAAAVPAIIGTGLKMIGKKLDEAHSDHGAKVLSQVFAQHPELKHNAEQVTANYATMQKFSPTLAKDPNASGSLLLNINQLGTGGMTYHVLSDLAKMESNVAKARHDTGGGFFQELGGDMGRGYGDIGREVGKQRMSGLFS